MPDREPGDDDHLHDDIIDVYHAYICIEPKKILTFYENKFVTYLDRPSSNFEIIPNEYTTTILLEEHRGTRSLSFDLPFDTQLKSVIFEGVHTAGSAQASTKNIEWIPLDKRKYLALHFLLDENDMKNARFKTHTPMCVYRWLELKEILERRVLGYSQKINEIWHKTLIPYLSNFYPNLIHDPSMFYKTLFQTCHPKVQNRLMGSSQTYRKRAYPDEDDYRMALRSHRYAP